ncbi:MAG TPA: hypothetical protein VG962_08760 [Steroidobacteraceae bacterium]|nr:hypothetical protein [Steroidobacteraceae bacterium]
MIDPVQPKSGKRTFVWVLLAFFSPLLLAFVVYYGTGWRPGKTSNKGDLISPVVSLPDVALSKPDGSLLNANWLHGKWTLVYAGDGACDQACRDALLKTRTVRLLLGKDTTRVQRAFLYGGTCCDQQYFASEQPDVIVARADDVSGKRLLNLFPQYGGPAMQAQRIYIIDPLGNLMMSYRPGADARDLHEDLKKLLSLSHIG